MTELKPINFGMNKYCVPAVMSALTGRSTDECAAVITSINGRQEIKAVNVPDIIKAFKKLHFDIEEQPILGRTLFGVLSRLAASDGIYLILVPKHIVAIRIENGQVQLVDNASKEPLDASASARLTQQVDKILKITEKPQPVFIDSTFVTRHDVYGDMIKIYKHNNYVNKEDDTDSFIGSIVYKDESELRQIIEVLKGEL
jgi:hypothetical protein